MKYKNFSIILYYPNHLNGKTGTKDPGVEKINILGNICWLFLI